MNESEEKELLESLCNKHQRCKECFCNDLCIFLLMKTGVATSCEDFRRRVGNVVDREIKKLLTKLS